MSKKPQGTFTVDEVTQLYLRLWELCEVVETNDKQIIRIALGEVFGAIPRTTTNIGAFTRARNILRKQAASAAATSIFDDLSEAAQIAHLEQLWGEEEGRK